MKGKKFILRILTISAWTTICLAVLVLLIAANRKEKAHICSDVVVSIKSNGDKYFIEEKDIIREINGTASIVNRPLKEINLSKLEHTLQKHLWIQDAELYFDSREVLHIVVTEREPVARVFTRSGHSFYIDRFGTRMPLLSAESIRLLVVTGFATSKNLNDRDSVTLNDLLILVQYINAHPFWNAQISQVDISADGRFELLPLLGNHVIRIGGIENLDDKFQKLSVFYKQVLARKGLDKYKVVDVQYKDQVLGIQHPEGGEIDSIRLKMEIEALIEESRRMVTQHPPVISNSVNREGGQAAHTLSINASLSNENKKPNEERQPKAVLKRKQR